MTPVLNLTGQRFGYLTVLSRGPNGPQGGSRWRCQCVCGKTILTFGSALRHGNKRACGVDGHRYTDEAVRIKGASELYKSEYRTWSMMLSRCRDPKSSGYKWYGARGIKVCERWYNFKNFFEDMGVKPGADYSIDRIDPNGDYTPQNCRWADTAQQAGNKRNTAFVEYDGRLRRLTDVVKETGISANRIIYKIAIKKPNDKTAVEPKPSPKPSPERCSKCGKLYALVGYKHLCP